MWLVMHGGNAYGKCVEKGHEFFGNHACCPGLLGRPPRVIGPEVPIRRGPRGLNHRSMGSAGPARASTSSIAGIRSPTQAALAN